MEPITQDKKSLVSTIGRCWVFANFASNAIPAIMFLKLLGDERQRMKENKRTQASMVQPMSAERRRAMIICAVALVIQLIGMLLIGFGVGTTGVGPAYALRNIFFKFRLPYSLSDILNPYFLVLTALPSVASLGVYYWEFARSKSLYKRMTTGILKKGHGFDDTSARSDRTNAKLSKECFWYYPGAFLFAHLNGQIGEDFVKDKAFWRDVGFMPSEDVIKNDGKTNSYLFIAAVKKASDSTMIYDRYEEWQGLVGDLQKNYYWYFGEYVKRNDYVWRNAFENFSTAFIGQSGSGKTEAMKTFLLNWMCKLPDSRLIITDPKAAADWDVFGPFTESGRILKTKEEILLGIASCEEMHEKRTAYMASKGYKDIRAWSETENVSVPPILLILDEFPQLGGVLKYEVYSRKDGTPAHTLFRLLTMGRSAGVWVVLGSQFSTSDAIPSDINKNIKNHVVLRTGSEGESMQWIGTGAAFYLGKRAEKEDGTVDSQAGYAYVDSEANFSRFWYADDWLIIHELMKYGVPTTRGSDYIIPRKMSVPGDIKQRIKAADGNLSKLSFLDRRIIANNEAAQKRFEKSFAEMQKNPNPKLAEKKEPIILKWKDEEPMEEYYARIKKSVQENRAALAAEKSSGGLPSQEKKQDTTPVTPTTPVASNIPSFKYDATAASSEPELGISVAKVSERSKKKAADLSDKVSEFDSMIELRRIERQKILRRIKEEDSRKPPRPRSTSRSQKK